MYLTKVRFKGFKNLQGDYTPDTGLNILVYPNGWGKTNFLEAIDYLSTLKSFRGIKDADLRSWDGGLFSSVEAEVSNDIDRLLKVVIAEENEKLKKNLYLDNSTTNSNKFKSTVKTLLYSPHNADIVSSSPDIRRNEFDRSIGQVFNGYDSLLKEYKYVVRNRNKLLQSIQSSNSQVKELTYWNERLIDLGEQIIERRLKFLHDIKSFLTEISDEMMADRFDDLKVIYESKSVEDHVIILKNKIEEGQVKEIRAGMTLYGPHRDDYIFTIRKRSLREYGSRGQQRLAGLTFMLSIHRLLREKEGHDAVLLLDDIMSELDEEHRSNIEDILGSLHTQIFVTSSERGYFTEEFISKGKLL